MNKGLRSVSLVLALTGSLLLGACSTGSQESRRVVVGDIVIDDRFEETNRAIFAFNDVVSDTVIHPIVEGYRFAVPKPARTGIRNVLLNLKSPVTLLNQLLQGDLDGAGNVITRAAVNTFIGLGGLIDVAGHEGYEYESEDFGQTMAVWGIGHGPYLVGPVVGPSSLRDFAGYAVDSFADPLRYYLHNIDEEEWYYVKVGIEYLDLRESFIDVLEDLEASSIDYYAAVRSTYYQRRQALINDQSQYRATPSSAPASENAYPDFDDF